MGRLRLVASLFLALVLLSPKRVRADPLPTGEPLDEEDRIESGEPAPGTPLWVALTGQLSEGSGRVQTGFILALGGSFDRLAGRHKLRSPRPANRPSTDEAFDAFDDPADTKQRPKRDIDLASDVEGEAESAPSARVADGTFARGLVRAAFRASKRGAKEDRLDALATRAKASALLPEVRVRVGRNLDQAVALVPSATDPQRTTATDGAKLLIEGRATFKLDRLVFADEEVQVEKLRMERERVEKALVEEVLRDLAMWQRAVLASRDPSLPRDAALDNEVTAIAATEALDVLSDGWFSAHAHEMRSAGGAASLRTGSPLPDVAPGKEHRRDPPGERVAARLTASSGREADRPGAAP